MKISIGKKTDIGCVREANEDSLYIDLPQEGGATPDRYALLLVADGMGGQVAGKEASETAVDMVKSLFSDTSKAKKPIDDIRTFITASFREANKAVFEKGKAKAAEMGTTLTTAFIDNQHAFIGHVGDSRAYHLRGKEIRQVTEDHTLAEDMVRKARATREEMQNSPMRSMLTRSIGTKEEVTIDQPIGIELHEGDVLLLCTDGLTNLVKEGEILSTIHNTADVQTACDKLVDMARARGGHDNITVIAAEFGELQRIKGLGIRAKTTAVKSVTKKKDAKRKRLYIATIGLLVAVFIFLAYLFVAHYVIQDRFYKAPMGGGGQTDVEGGISP
ncbi:MAG: Stp1/IreP family PP2C-type Ser/Thr phosphatase [Deltaproteobacteria bacterium]|nr:Stp1/IreP family PP2C-type Ser/Thr phosphatase [Deltaproteobacteria bacterium]